MVVYYSYSFMKVCGVQVSTRGSPKLPMLTQLTFFRVKAGEEEDEFGFSAPNSRPSDPTSPILGAEKNTAVRIHSLLLHRSP